MPCHVTDDAWAAAFRKPMKTLTPEEYKFDFLGYPPACLNLGGMGPVDGRILADLACRWGGHVLEIGVEYGNSSFYIEMGQHERALRGDGGYLIFSVDIQDVREYRPHNQVFAKCPSVCFDPGRQCNWAFIDGDHSYKGVVADIEHCLNIGIPRLVFHDAREDDPTDGENNQKGTDVLRAVKDTLGPEWDLTLITTPCGLLIAESHE